MYIVVYWDPASFKGSILVGKPPPCKDEHIEWEWTSQHPPNLLQGQSWSKVCAVGLIELKKPLEHDHLLAIKLVTTKWFEYRPQNCTTKLVTSATISLVGPGQKSFEILRPRFQTLYERINHQYPHNLSPNDILTSNISKQSLVYYKILKLIVVGPHNF